MNQAKLVMAILALAGILAMFSIGIAIAAGSVLGILGGIVLVIAIFGTGFTLKRKFRDRGLL
ncbi:DUF5325 family protein [Kurthia sibirica]|uniref:Uncharacterized protein n=1 Tax=Kurthia sibirica TaxID=202750 RepID=A0A2U3AQH8_9BACL|nr:DUF5325 family protein [Kurthia sibirica]PWI26784.1 hypothetical protein DEX24_00350 [Kurthia sibirica]GEK32682.1 hypothetical protein KSI01_02150 [Kurthia sibirica]